MTEDVFNCSNNIIVCAEKALEFDNSEEMKLSVYKHILLYCKDVIQICKNCLSDTRNIEALYNTYYSENPFSASQQTRSDDNILDSTIAVEPYILELRSFVLDNAITENKELQEIVISIAYRWKRYQEMINYRLNVYGKHMSDYTLEEYKKNLRRIKQGLPNQNVAKEDNLTNEKASFQYWPVIIGIIIYIYYYLRYCME